MIAATPFVYRPETYNESNVMVTTFQIGNKVVMRANITNKGGAAISSVILNLTASNGTLIYNNQAMTDNQDTCPGPATCDVYEKNYTLLPPDPIGTWIINVTATDINSATSKNGTTFAITQADIIVNLTNPDPSLYTGANPLGVVQNKTFWVNATVTCENAGCGDVYGTIRYNDSSSIPDKSISTTNGATPLYIVSAMVRPISYAYNGSVGYSVLNPKRGFDNLLNDTDTTADIIAGNNIGDWVRVNYTYSLGGSTSATLFVTAGYGIDQGANASVYNFNTGKWVTWFTPTTTTPTTNSTSISTAANTINATGHVVVSFFSYKTATVTSGISCFDTYVDLVGNNLHCGSMGPGNNITNCNLTWVVNATGNIDSAYKVGVQFNSSYSSIPKNHTNNATIHIKGGNLTVSLDTPTAGATTNVVQYSLFNVNSIVTCRHADCSSVYGTLKYNNTIIYPDTAISNAVNGATPFYIRGYRPYTYSTTTLGLGTVTNPGSAYDRGYNDETTYALADCGGAGAGNNADIDYTFNIGTQGSAVLYIKAEKSDANFPGILYVWNYTSGSTYGTGITLDNTIRQYTIPLNRSGGLINSDGKVMFRVDNWCGENREDVLLYDTYIKIDNPQYCGNMNQNGVCQLNWTVNATNTPVTIKNITVQYSSTSAVSGNVTNPNATIKIIECTESMTLAMDSVSFGNLNPNTAGSNNPATGNANDLYNITNTGTCTLKVWINATDLVNDTYNTRINVGNLTWSNRSNDYSTSYVMTNKYALLNSSFTQAIYNITTYYWLAVPPIQAGRYEGNMTFCWNTTQASGESDTCLT